MLKFKLRERIADLEFRERRRVSLHEIAETTGLYHMTLSELINQLGANVQTDVIGRLCAYFGCRVEDLMEFVDDSNSSIPPAV